MAKSPASKPLLASDKPVRSRPRKPRDPAQPNLPFDPMPDRIEPCLALLKPKPPRGEQWVYEIKWDGYRLAVHIEPQRVRIITRGGHDWTHRFPAIERAARQLGVATAILDGEAIVVDERGRSDFGLLQQSLGGRGGKRTSGEALFVAFDLLYFDGHDLRQLELSSRRHLLEGLIIDRAGVIRLSEEFEADGDRLLELACEHGLEGIIAKDRRSEYRSGRLGDWVKIKCLESDSFVIVGYELSTVARAGIGSLLLAARKGNGLVYVGNVGTGFNERAAQELREKLDRLKVTKPAVTYDGRRKGLVWVRPTLIAEIEYRAWTHDGKLRHASYKGLRDEEDDAVIYVLGK
ncbi:ATP-dependent DNA ligase [Rhizobium sp. SEMIA 4085]|uniref:DNA ligase (ATP) n=1 Tax=Rhizobium gallicum bv. gallicum R602sp TaxID=1041138 RepID=A0A0B4X7Y9_9HYPH|nr:MULTISPECIES: non-homologous end-joining DNA ligase [Rhizobium]AJD42597.1 ATP-dependent DNA ligase protein [Rhizobium gallicum bv. gallicum R602sp]NNH30490.1 ATP-dependent DNA ligase [Rhizobium sp. SEMIA 4085]TDW16162.1 bifunctional non-homologous end joining protein LigD [Rhizobium azibense]